MVSPSSTSEDMEKGMDDNGAAAEPSHKSKPSVPLHSSKEPTESLGRLGLYLSQFERQLIKYNLEARGLQRVEPHETHARTGKDYIQAFLMWVSVNLAAVNVTLGMLAPTVYYLSFKDAALCAAFGSLLGSTAVAYMATWGPISGTRTMIFTRYTFGWWPSKLIVLLNLIILLGYSMIGLVVGGQILSAVSSNGHLSVVVGIIINAVISWVITTFGISIYHTYMRYAWLPQLIAYCILYGVSAPQFDLATPTEGDSRTKIGNRLSFFSLCFSAAITYAGGAMDFFVYYPPSTPRFPLFLISLLGLAFSFSFALIVGVGLASGVTSNAAYSAAYSIGQGTLLVEGFSSLHGFGKFLGVVIALGLISNIIFPTYSCGIDFQVLGRPAEKVPRFVWNTFGVIVYTVCALAGRGHLSEIFTNFLALMGYWVAIWIAIILEEQLIFRRRTGYDWTVWNQPKKLPIGIAALIAFLVGWAGAILCMAQVWYIGPIAKQVGEYGADVHFIHSSYGELASLLSLTVLTFWADGQLCWIFMGCTCVSASSMA